MSPRLNLPLVAALCLLASGCSPSDSEGADPSRSQETDPAPPVLVVTPQMSGTDVLLQAISPVDESVVWVSGHGGTWGRTTDGGSSWTTEVMPGEENLQFRDIDAIDAESAYLMSAGTGEQSRIYRTDDAGATWRLQYTASDSAAFLDCLASWDDARAIAYGDAVDRVPFILRTEDGGETWARVQASGLPAALEGEGGFAASGSCVEAGPGGSAWIATGNAPSARVLRTSDFGVMWEASSVPVRGGSASGLTSIRFVDGMRGLAVGGVIGGDTLRVPGVALSGDGGATWQAGGVLAKPGPAYGAAVLPSAGGFVAVAVGPGGMDLSVDGGMSWSSVDTVTRWAAAFAEGGVGWAVGPGGRIDRLAVEGGR